MLKEIGSEYWLSEVPEQKSANQLPLCFEKWPNLTLTSSGRGAICLAIESVKNKIPKTALLPAYCCESMILPFEKHGFTISFYDINSKLEADIDSIQAQTRKDIGIFVHLGYFGFETNHELGSLLEKLKASGTFILEDVTHTLLSNFKRNELNDFYIASIRKWIGIPGGGFVSSKEKHTYKLEKVTEFSIIRQNALIKKSEYIKTWNESLKSEFLDLFKRAEDILDNDPQAYKIDSASETILHNTNFKELIEKRRRNYSYLSETIQNNKNIKCIFPELPAGICPLFLPVYSDNRDKLQKYLIENKVFAPIHWPKPTKVDPKKNPGCENIRNNIISIPIDQRYSLAEMDKIAYIINKFKIEN
jgi:dTDP-4-amino-4,6-dideoxygalactose transaminase